VTFKVRTNLQPNASFPIHELGIYSNSNPGPIATVLNGGQFGGFWYTDSHPTLPYNKGEDDNNNPYPSGTSPFNQYGNCN